MTLPAALTVLDGAGRIVPETQLPPSVYDHEIDIVHLPAGVYLARVVTGAVRWVKGK